MRVSQSTVWRLQRQEHELTRDLRHQRDRTRAAIVAHAITKMMRRPALPGKFKKAVMSRFMDTSQQEVVAKTASPERRESMAAGVRMFTADIPDAMLPRRTGQHDAHASMKAQAESTLKPHVLAAIEAIEKSTKSIPPIPGDKKKNRAWSILRNKAIKY
ncbi:hypothetical protein CYMTET_30765 [Cymbomonas tetramitiformis]|uniref:Uncharacterized protein n=1 Tax=Cymbomonas tetramitiformis TaxID=36881 RepID=A0AAE0KTM0_9CHLO|nr:hypothetical protein CYMTET_30765 [Cymbomonas tetramitiformis]